MGTASGCELSVQLDDRGLLQQVVVGDEPGASIERRTPERVRVRLLDGAVGRVGRDLVEEPEVAEEDRDEAAGLAGEAVGAVMGERGPCKPLRATQVRAASRH